MRSPVPALVALLIGCGSPATEGDTDTPTCGEDCVATDDAPTWSHSGGHSAGSPTGDTGVPTTTTDTGPSTPVSASCTQTRQPLVFECAVTLSSPGPATVVFSAPGAPTRSFTSAEPAVEHVLYGFGLLPSTTYDWDAGGGVFGRARTGDLPQELRNASIRVSGTLFGADAALVYVKCGYFVMIDGEGRIVWYLPTDVYSRFTDGMRWSQADRSLLALKDSAMSAGPSEVLESHVSGRELLHLTPAELDLRLTHDLDRWNGYTYVLGEAPSMMGGFEVFQGTTKLGQWMLTDGFPSVPEPGLQLAHVNGLSVSEDGQVLVTVHGADTVVSVDGDPSSPTFLQMSWHATGNPDGVNELPNPDYAPAAGTLFYGPHNGNLNDGELWVFDNLSQAGARAVRMAMDSKTGELTELEAWSTGYSPDRCANQGGALPIPGGALVTCANEDVVQAFRHGASVPDWTLTATCGAPAGGSSTRAYPVVFE